jgi:hypothetical protein
MATTPTRKAVDQGFGRTSRRYVTPAGELDSVTSILNVLAKPALVAWSANLERDYVVNIAADVWDEARDTGQTTLPRAFYLSTLLQRLGPKKAHQLALATAADIGSQTHARIEWHLRRELGRPVGPEPKVEDAALWAFMAYEDWRQAVSLKPRAVEQVVWSATHRYAGTLDCFADALLPDHGACTLVVDWKSGKGIYDEALLQSVAYVRALCELGLATPPVYGCIVRVPKIETDPAFEVRVIPPAEQAELFAAFLSIKDVWDWTQRQAARRRELTP